MIAAPVLLNALFNYNIGNVILLSLLDEGYRSDDKCILQSPIGTSRVCMNSVHYQKHLFSLEDLQSL